MLKIKKSQVVSTDVIVVVIIVLFGALFLVLSQIKGVSDVTVEEKYEAASLEANVIMNNLKSKNIVSEDNVIDVDRLLTLNGDELKNELGIKNKFCIVIEKDGKLVKIDPEKNLHGLGSEEIIVNDEPCQ